MHTRTLIAAACDSRILAIQMIVTRTKSQLREATAEIVPGFVRHYCDASGQSDEEIVESFNRDGDWQGNFCGGEWGNDNEVIMLSNRDVSQKLSMLS